MGSIDHTQPGSLDRILKEKVEGKNPQLHNACFAVIGKEGMCKCLRVSPRPYSVLGMQFR
jgi:hypothetical protein